MHQSSDKPLKETDFDANKEIHPNYFGVGWTKVYIEKMCEFYSRIGNTKYTVIRHTNIFGPYDKYDLKRSHVFGATMTKIMTTEEGQNIEVWGTGEEERLVEVVRQHAGGTAREIRDAVLEAVAEHTAGTPQSDDITLVVIKRNG